MNGQRYCSVRGKTVSNGRSNIGRRTPNAQPPSIMDMSCSNTATKTGDTTTVRSTKQLPSKAKQELNKPILENLASKLSSMKVKRKNITFTLD
jgi:hypothetical protein